MTAILDTYCRNERPEFSLFGNFVRKRNELSEFNGNLDIALVKSDSLEIYKVTFENKIEYVTSSMLLLTPIASATIKGVDGAADYIALLLMNWELLIYRYSIEFDELELVSKDTINIEDLLEGSENLNFSGVIDVDENVKMEQIVFGNTLDTNCLSIMLTFAKYLVFISYKVDSSGYFGQKLVLDVCWGISSEADLCVDTIVDSCLVYDEHSMMYLQPRIALLTRTGPVSNGAIQSHSNSSSLFYLNLNMKISEFTLLEKLELLPMDAYKLLSIDTRKNPNNSLISGVIILARSCILVHTGLQRPFTLVNVNDHYNVIPEKKLEIDICTRRIHNFNPKVFSMDNGDILDGSLQTLSTGGSNLMSSIDSHKASLGENMSCDNSNILTNLKSPLPNFQPILLNDSELSMDLEVSHSVPFIVTNNYYGILLFNKVQPHLILLVLQISNEKPNGISRFYWVKVNEYWDWSGSYLGNNDNIMTLETTACSKSLGSGLSEMDEHYLITITPIFPIQNCHVIPNKSTSETGDIILCMVGDFSSNSGISILSFSFGSKFGLATPTIKEFNNTDDNGLNLVGYSSVLEMVKDFEGGRDYQISGNKKTKSDFKSLSIQDIEKEYLLSGINLKIKHSSPDSVICDNNTIANFEIIDYLDLGPCLLKDFCLLPNQEENENDSEPNNEGEMNDQEIIGGNNSIKISVDDNHSILTTNGSYPIGQLCLYMKYISKSTIAQFSLDDIIFHWVINNPFTGKTKYLVFTTDPLKSIGKTYIFSLESVNTVNSEHKDEKSDVRNNNNVVIGDVNQLDPSEGEYEYEPDSNTVGAGLIQIGKNSLKDAYVVQILPSSIYILDYEIKTRVLEIDLIDFLFDGRMDAPLAIKGFIVNNHSIVILFEDSSVKILKFIENQEDIDNGKNNLKRFDFFSVILEDNLELKSQLKELSRLNLTIVNERVGIGDDVSQRLNSFIEDEKSGEEDVFWIRHISKMVSSDENSCTEMLLVLVVYSKVWLNGSLLIYDLESKRVIFFSPYVSSVPSLLRNVISPSNSTEDTLYRFLECEFDLGRPITSLSTPIIEPKLYNYDNNSLSISTCINFDYDLVSEECQHRNSETNRNSFLISSELLKFGTYGDMLLIVTVSQRPTLIYKLNLRDHANCGTFCDYNSTNPSGICSNNKYCIKEGILRNKWNLQIQPNCSNAQMDINKFFPLFPRILTSENITEAFSNESPLSTYNSGHVALFSNNVDTWVFQPPSAINTQEVIDKNSKSEKQKHCSPLVIMYNRRRLSVINFENKTTVNCMASINSPWSSSKILLTTNLNNEIKFRYLNTPQLPSYSRSEANTDLSEDPCLNKALSTIPFPCKDNWFIRKVYLPEVVIKRVSYCKKHRLVALIVGIPDNAKHHLNGYHIRQMAFYRYLRCLEAGGKEAQTILMNQDLIRNPDKCFEKSLTSIPDLGVPSASYETETYFETLPPGIEIGEILPKIINQSNLINKKSRERLKSNSELGNLTTSDENHCNTENGGINSNRDYVNEQFGDLMDLNILRNELLVFLMDDLFPQSKPASSLLNSSISDFPKPIGRFAFGAWEVGLSLKFGKDSKGQDMLVVGTGTNPTHYFEAEGRLLMFKVKQLLSESEGSRLKTSVDFADIDRGDSKVFKLGLRSGNASNGPNNSATGSKWLNLQKYWPSKFSQELYYNNVPEMEVYYSSMFRGPVTCVDLIDLPATTAPIAPAIPALAAYPIVQNNSVIRVPTSKVTYVSHTLGYRLFIHELRENETGFVKGTFMDTPLGITSVSNYKALFFLGDIRRGVHLGMLKTDVFRGSQTMVKLARSHPLWKFTCTSAQAIIQDREMTILVSDNKNNVFTFEPSFNSTQIIDKETLRPTSHAFINTTIVQMKTVKSGNEHYAIASGRNGSFLLIRFINEGQQKKFHQLEKLLSSNIPSFLGISPKTIRMVNNNQESIPEFIKELYPTSQIFLLKHFDFIKYLSNPILKSIFKNSNFTINGINQFIV